MHLLLKKTQILLIQIAAIIVLLFVFLFLVDIILLQNDSRSKDQAFMQELSLAVEENIDLETIVARLGGNNNDLSEIKKSDKRVAILKLIFRKYDSPLYDFADFIVKTSDTVGIDYRIIPSIAMHESSGCKRIPSNSYNCWGYGIYGDKVTRFSSYEEAIETVARGLKKNYIDKGLTTPEAIMKKYTPPSDGSWARSVNFFLGKF